MFLLLERVKNKITKMYRCALFRKQTKCECKNLNIFGKIYVINNNIVCGRNCLIMPGVQFFGDGKIIIGDRVSIGNNTIIYSSKGDGGIYIGNNVQIAAQSYIIDADHGIKAGELIANQPNTVSPIVIEDDVWISAGCKVLKGSVIKKGAVIGAASVVKGEIPENAIAVGIPAKVKKFRG